MAQISETPDTLTLEWESQHLISKRSGIPFVTADSAWVTVSGLKNRVRLRRGGRIRAVISGCPERGYRADLLGEMEYDKVLPFRTVGCEFTSMEQAQRGAESAIRSYGIIPEGS